MGKDIDVVVVGGGYAGVMAANRLTQRDDVRVTVINPRPVFVPRLRLHQLVAGPTMRSSTMRTSWPRVSGWSSTARHGSTRPGAA